MLRATGACEQMLAHGLAECPESNAVTLPIVPGIAGGLQGSAASFLSTTHTPTNPPKPCQRHQQPPHRWIEA
jgi:hypothetical protein